MSKMVIKSEEKRLVFGEVYAPWQIDTDGEAMLPEDIEKMAHDFLASGRVNKIDEQHNLTESNCLVVESFIARKGDPDGFIEGAWVLGTHIIPDDLWEKVKKGEINGYSFYGPVTQVSVSAVVLATRHITGKTEASADGFLPPHTHDLDIKFSKDDKVITGLTSSNLNHCHVVTRTTATEIELEHAHRMVLIDNEED
jgi:hypothetical protein